MSPTTVAESNAVETAVVDDASISEHHTSIPDSKSLSNGSAQPALPPERRVRLATPEETRAIRFPDTRYIGVAADFAELYSRHYESPKEFFYWDFLGILGTAISGRVRADFDLPCQPRLYITKIAESAWRRKSTSARIAAKFLQEILQDFKDYPDYSSLLVYGVGSAEGLGKRLEIDHGNTDYLGTPLPIKTRRAVLQFDEFRRFEAKAGIQGSVLRPMVNEMFESNKYENLVKNKDSELRIPDGHLGFLSNTTDEGFRNLLHSAESVDIGFLNRFFFVVGSSGKRIARPQKPPESTLAPIREKLKSYFAELPPLRTDGSSSEELVIPLTPAADALWADWYGNIDETEETARLDVIGMRLMGLLAFASGKNAIDEDLVRRILDILEYQRLVRTIYRPNTGTNSTARMEQRIIQQLRQRGPLSERDLKRYTNANRDGLNIFSNAKNALIIAREIHWKDKKYEVKDAEQ